MAIRRADLKKSLSSAPQAPGRSVDPSPFSNSAGATGDSREERIARAAYRRAEERGFAPGGELEDWLMAERDIDAQ